jgi:hypothetical protein
MKSETPERGIDSSECIDDDGTAEREGKDADMDAWLPWRMRECCRLREYTSLLNEVPIYCWSFLLNACEENPANQSIHYQ